ncbi:X-ray radiation resistance-associated protein 1 [Mugil cephalus]|uniref:X-ray radiation resistance-associated protein 1 n=1 Tax=Mugil cephalus TaxID=48193 RepID=UPI001FB57209|nr:X-ray radiation resistance-associated protein 1 [Mugil cephalus]
MNSASYKFDDGQSFPTQCFPGGTLQHRREDGAGHWSVAYRETERKTCRTVNRRIKETYKKCESREAHSLQGVTLDGRLLLQLHCVDKPSELCSVNISEQKLNSVKPEDLKKFDNVAYIDASINYLSLGSFSSFTSLRELNLSLNGICNMTFDAVDFPYLEILDLSYNRLSADAIVSVGQLPRLKVLHLTGNQLHHLPPDLCSPRHDTTRLQAKVEDPQFKALEVLLLDDNRLSNEVFNSLKDLKRLKHLNLEGNYISEVPSLFLMGSSKPVQIPTEGREEGEECAHIDSNPNTDEILRRIFQGDDWEEYFKGVNVPLPELQFLNLANNKIANEEALMAVALLPMLLEVDIHSNPLSTQRRGASSLLTYFLQEKLGITIKRKKGQKVVKLPLKVSTDPEWKLEGQLQKLSKKTLITTETCPAKKQHKSEQAVKTATGSEGKSSRDKYTENIFITQTADIPEFDPPEKKETIENEERNSPEQFTSSTMLMDAKPNPDVLKPIRIQTAVRMLEHTLRNLNVYRDSKPKLDSIQTPYSEKEKKIKELPPLKPIKQLAERVDEMIKEMKESTTIKVVALGSAIHSTPMKKDEYKEALLLLKDMRAKYKMLHKQTMEQEASIESDRSTDPNASQSSHVQMLH